MNPTFKLLVLCLAFTSFVATAQDKATPVLSWDELPELPPAAGQTQQMGLAGAFSGVHNDVLIVAGRRELSTRPPLGWREKGLVERYLCSGAQH